MTALAVSCPAAAPTPFERALLAVSSRLSAFAVARMQRRAAAAGHRNALAPLDDARRDAAATLRAGLLPR